MREGRTKIMRRVIGVGYDYVDMDSFEGEEKKKTLEDLKCGNDGCK